MLHVVYLTSTAHFVRSHTMYIVHVHVYNLQYQPYGTQRNFPVTLILLVYLHVSLELVQNSLAHSYGSMHSTTVVLHCSEALNTTRNLEYFKINSLIQGYPAGDKPV